MKMGFQAEILRQWAGSLRPFPSSPEALRRLQSARIRRLAHFAAEQSPYYRDLWGRMGIHARDLRSPEDLARLPVLEKETAWARRADLLAHPSGITACAIRHTSGTTGMHVSLPVVPGENGIDANLWARCYMQGGHYPWRLQARVMLRSRNPGAQRLLQRIGWFRRAYLDAMDPPAAKVEWLRRVQPYSLVCFSGTLNEIVTELERTGERLHIPRVFSTGSMLWPHVRQRAEQRMAGRVMDAYGAVETGPIAWECERQEGLHVRSDAVVVELLDDEDCPARQGRVVCTVLWRRTLPLIRYALGDTAEWEESPCSCGRPEPRLMRITGRVESLMTLPGGERINHVALRSPVIDKPGVDQYQMVQDAPGRFRFRVVPGPAFTADVERKIREEFQARFQDRLQLDIVRVPSIRTPPGHKTLSMVTLDYKSRLQSQGVDISCFSDDSVPSGTRR